MQQANKKQQKSIPRLWQAQRLVILLNVTFILLRSVFSGFADEPGREVQVFQGLGKWRIFLRDELKMDHNVVFTVYCDATNSKTWLIEFDYGAEYIKKFCSGTDGSNIVTVAYYRPEYTNATGYSIIEKTTIPRGDAFLPLSAIWIALCAPKYLDALTTNRISPPYFKDGDMISPGNFPTVEFDLLRATEGARYVKRMVFLHDGWSMSSRGELMKAPAPFDHGFTNAIFSTKQFSKSNQGLSDFGSYPQEFELNYYYIFTDLTPAKNWKLFLSQSCQLSVTNAYKTNFQGPLFPERPRRTALNIDRRFLTPETPSMVISYKADEYLSNDKARMLHEYKEAMMKQGKIAARIEDFGERKRISRFVILVTVACPLLTLLGYCAWFFRANNKRTER